MIWALLAILGVPLWLIVGALTGALVSRRRFRSQPDVFSLLLRRHDGKWPRSLAYGRLVRDVLLVNRGLGLIRTSVHVVEGADRLILDQELSKLDDPIAWTLQLDDGEVVDVAVNAAEVRLLTESSDSVFTDDTIGEPGVADGPGSHDG